ncbi:hypothetical protein WJX82_007719 [Trebouxia sp. C0006]
MTSLARQLSSLTSLPKILSDSLVTALAETDSDSLAYRLVPRPVYPIKLAIAAEGLALGPDPCRTQCQIHVQHDEVGSEILWTDVSSPECKSTSPIFSTREHPICVWVGDAADAVAPSMLQDALVPQELLQETVLLQEVLLTAHMARAYEFPTLEGGLAKVEVIIGAPQRGPYHLALRQANIGTFFADHNEDDVFAVLPLPPRGRRSFALPPKGPSPPRPSLQGRNSPSNHMKGRTVSFKERGGDGRIGVIASGVAKDTDNKPELRTARKSTSRKQLQFAPLQLGHIPAQPSRSPSTGADAEPLSLGRSKSLGSVVHMRDVTVFADEHAALELVSQGSIQSAARRVSHSKQVPLLDAERRRSHSRASTPTAKDMQTGAPSLDFQIMQLTGDGQGSFLSRCVQDDRGLCISTKDQHGKWQVWAHIHYPSGPAGHLQLQDIQSSSEAGASSSSAEGGLVEMACIAVRPLESDMHSQPSLAATKLYGSRGGSRPGSKAGSRTGSRAGSRRNLLASQLSEAGSISQTDSLANRCEWHPRRRATGDDVGWRGRLTDDSSVSGASCREPCPLALWFHESCASQAAALACLSYALYALTHAAAAGPAYLPTDQS